MKLTSECRYFIDNVKEHLSFLILEHDFSPAHIEDGRSGEYCMVVLESPSCRFRIVKEQNGVLAAFGNKDAPYTWPSSTRDSQVWYSVSLIENYMMGNPHKTVEELLESGKEVFRLTVDEKLIKLADQLKPRISDIVKIFLGSSQKYNLQDLSYYEKTR